MEINFADIEEFVCRLEALLAEYCLIREQLLKQYKRLADRESLQEQAAQLGKLSKEMGETEIVFIQMKKALERITEIYNTGEKIVEICIEGENNTCKSRFLKTSVINVETNFKWSVK